MIKHRDRDPQRHDCRFSGGISIGQGIGTNTFLMLPGKIKHEKLFHDRNKVGIANRRRVADLRKHFSHRCYHHLQYRMVGDSPDEGGAMAYEEACCVSISGYW